MKKLIFIFILFASCANPIGEIRNYYNPSPELLAKIDNEIQFISSSREFTEYLENINSLDQKYRNEEINILQVYGHDSKEHKAIWKKINRTDAENYFRVEAIFKKFGHPKIDSVGKQAALAPLYVIHHSPFYEHRTKHFGILYKAYLNGSIDESAFDLFMDRMYDMKNNRRFRMPGPYRMNEKIDTLINLLDLKDQIGC